MARLLLAMMVLLFGVSTALALPQQPPAKAVPAKYACPMKCEGVKTYDAAGKCPVCHMDLKMMAAQGYTLTVGGGPAKGNELSELSVTVADSAGSPVKDLAELRGTKMHLYIVLRDLAWFAHVEPVAQPDGSFAFKQTLPPGEFVILANFQPAGGTEQVAAGRFTASGKAANPKAMGVDADRPKTVDGLTVTLEGFKELKAGAESTLTFHVTAEGKPVTDLEAMHGAPGLLVGISPNLSQMVHGRSAGKDLTFKVKFAEAGLYRVWLQVQRGGKVSTVPFVVEAK